MVPCAFVKETTGQARLYKKNEGMRHIWPWLKIQIVPPVNIPIPAKTGSKMGGEFIYPKNGPVGFNNHSHLMAA